ncbi:MAG: toxin-antitoxin system HicB family antitoxin [Phycisphaerae bacterium]|nr:toxin-antitoxin system HicB family antitoxin [Phycisphaerae bacterium]
MKVQHLCKRLGGANGHLSVRVLRSIHAALLAKAKKEGISLNQLCLTKLAVQLRPPVMPDVQICAGPCRDHW